MRPTLWCAVAMLMACGGESTEMPNPGGGTQTLTGTPPPPSTQLPDGGMSSTPADGDRLLTQVQWFAANVKSCEMRIDTVTHEYAVASVRMDWSDNGYHGVTFVLGGAAATDTYRFTLDLASRFEIEIGPGYDPGETKYIHRTTIGRIKNLSLYVRAHDAVLNTYDGETMIRCSSLPY